MSENLPGRLPVEVLAEIFCWAAESIELPIQPQGRKYRNRPSPWVFALVSRDWRDVALSTPYIWSSISLLQNRQGIWPSIPPLQNRQTGHHQYNLSKICLDRSCDYPLTIKLDTSATLPLNRIHALLKLLMEHAQRWETVIICSSLDIVLPYISNYPAQYTRLRRLHIDANGKRAENCVGLFRDAPLLSDVSFGQPPYRGPRLSEIGIPWSQISHLHINTHFNTLYDLTHLLTNTPNLMSLDYSVVYDDFGDPEFPILELSRLERLVWSSSSDSPNGPSTFRFFRLLKAPRLSALNVIGLCDDEEVEAIRGCIQRSGCSITSLGVPTPHLPSLLNLTLDVETLFLPFLSEEHLVPLLRELTFDHSAVSWLCPKLKKIVLNFEIPAGPPFNVFIGMFKSRLRAPPNSLVRLRCNRLKELELGGSVTKHMKHWIQKRLTPQEPLVITYREFQWLNGRWDFTYRPTMPAFT